MGADRVLVDAAFKEAATKYGGDVINMKPMYDSNVAGMNKVFNTISGAMGIYSAKKEVGRAGVRKQMAGFQKQADSLIQGMYAQDEPLPDAFVNAFRGKIESLQKEFEDVNTYGKGDTSENSIARSRIMGELQRVTNQAKNFRAGTEIALDNLKDVDPGSLDKRGISAHMQAFDFENYEQLVRDGKIEVVYGKNGIEIISKDYDTKIDNIGTGEYTEEMGTDGNIMGSEITRQVESFEGDKVIITLASFNEKFKPVDLKSHVALGEDFVNSVRSATDAGGKQNAENDYNEAEYNALFTSHVDTEDKFKNFATSKIKGLHEIKESFKVSLENELNIPVAVLSNMFLDTNGDGVNDMPTILKELNLEEGTHIDADDVAKGQGSATFEQNLDELIDALTEVHHPAFDIGISAPMLGAYLGKINENRYNTAFDKAKRQNYKAPSQTLSVGEKWLNSGKQLPYQNGNRYMPYETAIKAHKSFETAGKGEDTYFGWANEKFTFLKDTGKWTGGSIPEDGYSTKQLIDFLGIDNDAFAGFENSTVVVVNESEIPKVSKEIMGLNWKKDKGDAVIAALESTYSDFPGFKFEYLAGLLRITHTESKVTDNFKMNKGKETRQGIRKFIQQNVNGKYILD